jgi:hypothetical protein
MLTLLVRRTGQCRAARTVEIYGWIIFVEGSFILLFPRVVATLLHFSLTTYEAANFLRMVGLLVGGVGMLYIVSGRLNAEGFVFASLLDRPLVPPIVATMWWLGVLPGPLALLFAVEDFASWLWTLCIWRADTQRG